jgi:hypothetical protein
VSRRSDRRSTSSANVRGSAAARRARRAWLVDHFGDGEFVACFQQRSPHCEYVCDVDTVSPDRVVLGADGGTYRRANLRPSCRPCQLHQGGEVGRVRRGLTPTSAVG